TLSRRERGPRMSFSTPETKHAGQRARTPPTSGTLFYEARSRVDTPTHCQATSPLINRQIPIFDRQRQNGHRRAVAAAAGAVVAVAGEPASVAVLVLEQDLDKLRVVREEVLVAHLEHGLRAVVDLVEEVRAGPAGRVLEQVLRAGDGLGSQVLAADLECEHASAGPRVVRAAAGLVAESPFAARAPLEVIDRAVDVLGGHRTA